MEMKKFSTVTDDVMARGVVLLHYSRGLSVG